MIIDWHSIETVLLDMDGTLLDLHYDNYFWHEYLPSHYARMHNMDARQARQLLIEKFFSKAGQLEFYCIDHWSKELDLELMPIKATAEVSHRIQFLPGALELLHKLKAMPVNTLLVTNAHRKTLQLKNKVVDISSYVDASYTSHDFGLPKEDPEFWHHLARKHPFNPQTTLLIDDNPSVLRSAQRFNIAHLVLPLRPDSQQAAQPHDLESGFLGVDSLDQLFV